jgi:hypothetical protein
MGGHFLLVSIGPGSGWINLAFEGSFLRKNLTGEGREFSAVFRAFLRGVLGKVVVS